MKHALKNSIKENMHGLLESIFVDYANRLRANYPDRISEREGFASGVPEFARRGFIELVDARTGIPEELPDFLFAQSNARNISRFGFQGSISLMTLGIFMSR